MQTKLDEDVSKILEEIPEIGDCEDPMREIPWIAEGVVKIPDGVLMCDGGEKELEIGKRYRHINSKVVIEILDYRDHHYYVKAIEGDDKGRNLYLHYGNEDYWTEEQGLVGLMGGNSRC